MKAVSLRARLLAGAAVWIGVALIALGLLMVQLFRTHIEASAQFNLNAALNRLVAQLSPDDIEPPAQPLADPRYELPYGGLYWQIEASDPQSLIRSPSLFDTTLSPAVPTGDATLQTLPGPAGTTILAVSREVSFDTGQTVRVTVAEDADQIEQAVERFTLQIGFALLVGWLALLLAALLQVQLGLSPLSRIRQGLETIRAGRAKRLQGNFPREVAPLVDQVNLLLTEQEASLDFARSRASDLAHGLRTPLAALQATANRLRKLGDASEAQAVEELSAVMTEHVEYQLRLTQLRLRSGGGASSAPLVKTIEQVVSVLKRTSKGEAIDWTISGPPDLAVRLDRQDLIELVGVLLENAARHANSRIEITAGRSGEMAVLTVTDDGPGMSREQMESATRRGIRHDQTSPGAGLGFAIAADIATINGGRIDFSDGHAQGLVVRVELPPAQIANLE